MAKRRKNKASVPTAQFRIPCAFCGGGDLSDEHLWPQWASDLIKGPDATGPNVGGMYEYTAGGRLLRSRVRERQGHVVTKRIRAVCTGCNNGWMNVIEGDVRPFATEMIQGNPVLLNEPEQRILATWIALKAMVGELNQTSMQATEAVTEPADRQLFRDRRTIPGYFTIWIGRCLGERWRHAFLRNASSAAILGKVDNVVARPVNPDLSRKTIQTTAIGFGQLFTLTLLSKLPELDLLRELPIPRQLARLWPPTGEAINWPLAAPLSDAEAENAAHALRQFQAGLERVPSPSWAIWAPK